MKQNLLIVSIILVTLTFIQNICNLPQTSVAHAEVKTFEGDGYYIADAINSELPEYAKQRDTKVWTSLLKQENFRK